jgi:hypothetical protein
MGCIGPHDQIAANGRVSRSGRRQEPPRRARARQQMAADTAAGMAAELAWLRAHWVLPTPPAELHVSAVEGELGGLRYSPAFARWLAGEARAVEPNAPATEACYHPLSAGDPVACPECDGRGAKTVRRDRYRWPMAAALIRLARDHPADVALLVRHAPDWPRHAAVARAIRRLRLRYRPGP